MTNSIKKIIAFWFGCGLALTAKAQIADSVQSAQVEKFSFGIQMGLPSGWVYGEQRLSEQFILRGELGIIAPIINIPFTPIVALEPRWYYNLAKRLKRAKDITDNSGNFLSARVILQPDYFRPNASGNTYIIVVIPAWGMRRNIDQYFNYELGIGMGNFYNTGSLQPLLTAAAVFYPHIYARIGYRFSKGTHRKK